MCSSRLVKLDGLLQRLLTSKFNHDLAASGISATLYETHCGMTRPDGTDVDFCVNSMKVDRLSSTSFVGATKP